MFSSYVGHPQGPANSRGRVSYRGLCAHVERGMVPPLFDVPDGVTVAQLTLNQSV